MAAPREARSPLVITDRPWYGLDEQEMVVGPRTMTGRGPRICAPRRRAGALGASRRRAAVVRRRGGVLPRAPSGGPGCRPGAPADQVPPRRARAAEPRDRAVARGRVQA